MGNNEGREYKAYFNLTDKNNQQIIFYKDRDLKELEISLTNGKLKIVYDGKDITGTLKKYKNELSKYPYTFVDIIFYETGTEYLFRIIDLSIYFGVIKAEDSAITVYDYQKQGYKYLVEGLGGESIFIDDKYRIKAYYDGNGEKWTYIWDKNTISKIELDMFEMEGVTVKFLDPKGFVIKK